MACHFICALGILALNKTKKWLHVQSINDAEEEDVEMQDEYDENFDIEVSMDVEATEDNGKAVLAALVTDFEAGDVVSKLMAFVAQIHSCAKDT
jgi:hypothetical protein